MDCNTCIRIDHHSSFGTHTSPSISLGYDVNAKTNVYAAYKEYFLAPTPYQLFDGFNGNRNLKPETGHEWSLGVHHKSVKLGTAISTSLVAVQKIKLVG